MQHDKSSFHIRGMSDLERVNRTGNGGHHSPGSCIRRSVIVEIVVGEPLMRTLERHARKALRCLNCSESVAIDTHR